MLQSNPNAGTKVPKIKNVDKTTSSQTTAEVQAAPPHSVKDIEGLAKKANGYSVFANGSEKYYAFNEGFIEGYKAAQSSPIE